MVGLETETDVTPRVTIKAELLQWACERGGQDLDAFVGRFPQLPAWLRGESEPTLKQLEALAKATRTPIGYFFLHTPPAEPVPLPDLRTMPGGPRPPSPN